jgi:hypothetical protein
MKYTIEKANEILNFRLNEFYPQHKLCMFIPAEEHDAEKPLNIAAKILTHIVTYKL